MENKNEDSLDRSLKKKCVVAADSEDEKEDDVRPAKMNKNVITSNIPLRNNESNNVVVVGSSTAVKKVSDLIKCDDVKKISDFAGQNDMNSEHNIYKRSNEPIVLDNLKNINSTLEITSAIIENKRLSKNDETETAINNVMATKVQNLTNDKTEHGNDDYDAGGGGGEEAGVIGVEGGNNNNSRIASALDPVELTLPTCSTKSRRKADVDDTSTSSDDSQKQASALSTKSFGDLDLNDDDDGETTDSTIDNKSQDSKSFASKVKQISENLQGTTLGDDCDERLNNSGKKVIVNSTGKEATVTLVDNNDTSSSSSSSDNDKTLTEESSGQFVEVTYMNKSICSASKTETCSSNHQICSNIDDVKSIDKSSDYNPPPSHSTTNNVNAARFENCLSNDKKNAGIIVNKYHQNSEGEDDEEDLESELYPEDDEELLMAAISHRLGMRPLSFNSPYAEKAATLSKQKSKSTDDEDEKIRLELKRELPPENGIQKILGKHIHCGKTQYLLRLVEKSGLYWETEEFLRKTCPTLIEKYENDRELEREQHVRYLNGRKRSRQRFNM